MPKDTDISLEESKWNVVTFHTRDDTRVTLYQTGSDIFAVRYGKQLKTMLTYDGAAMEYGVCVMHSAACMGKIDQTGPPTEMLDPADHEAIHNDPAN